MMRAVFCSLFLLLVTSAGAQEKSANATKTAHGKKSDAALPACKNLSTLGALVDGAFDGQKNETRMIKAVLTDPDDAIWDELIGCSEATTKASERTEALRVAAIWEQLRAAAFQKMFLEEKAAREPETASATATAGGRESRPSQTLAEAQAAGAAREAEAQRALAIARTEAVRRTEERKEALDAALAKTSNWILNDTGWPMSSEAFAKVAAHNRALCDQTITVGGLTPNGLALYIPPLGQQFMMKNSKNYPRMCLLEDSSHSMPGVPNYLLVYAYSENAFVGFHPVSRTTTAPVSGTGTITNVYGNQWNFTYTGTLSEIDTIEAPFVIQSRSLYLNAYDENGKIVSRHSISVSSLVGGDPSYAAGYNAVALISLLWNNPSHLIKSVLKDVEQNSVKYPTR